MTYQFTKDELTFMQRMLPHFMAGKSAIEAAEAVLEDDARLLGAAFERRQYHYVPTPDEMGRSHTEPAGKGDVIFSEISRAVYQRLTEVEAV